MNPNNVSFRVISRSVLALLFGTLVAGPAWAQSLGDVARQEQARRRTVTGGKVYTNGSLPAEAPAAAPAPAQQTGSAAAGAPAAGQAPAPAPGGKAADPTAKKDEPKDEAYWRKRLQAEREALSRAESFAEALQSRINALSTDFVNRDDPAQRNVIAGDRQKALSEMDRVKKEITEHTKAIADIQQEGRREGVPAGWLR